MLLFCFLLLPYQLPPPLPPSSSPPFSQGSHSQGCRPPVSQSVPPARVRPSVCLSIRVLGSAFSALGSCLIPPDRLDRCRLLISCPSRPIADLCSPPAKTECSFVGVISHLISSCWSGSASGLCSLSLSTPTAPPRSESTLSASFPPLWDAGPRSPLSRARIASTFRLKTGALPFFQRRRPQTQPTTGTHPPTHHLPVPSV